jgi:hypothetical protein
MQSALYHAVSEIVTGRRPPPEWEGAVVKLLPKRAGEEHILESNRPICLMVTAMKLVTGIWLSKAAESLGHFESAQEGNRPARSTRRQTARLLLNLETAKVRQSSVFVAFLDMENFFNAFSLPTLFFLLWKSGLPDHDIATLKQYYDSVYMVIMHNRGCKSARIPLRRGVRQGCPLSPILGCIMINMLIRWVEDAGGGMSHPSVVITTIMVF